MNDITDDYVIELHKAERRAEQAYDLLAKLYRAACGTPHLAHNHKTLDCEVRAFLFSFKPGR